MKGIKIIIDKSSLIEKIPEEYRDKDIVFAKVDNQFDYVEITAIFLTEDKGGSDNLRNAIREKL
ncbi:hypothetical protein D3C74_403390 [compost metagenome]